MSVLDGLTIREIAAIAADDENAGTVPVRVRVVAARGRMAELATLGDVVGAPGYAHLLGARERVALADAGAIPMHRPSAAA
jgi:hypothetical protein